MAQFITVPYQGTSHRMDLARVTAIVPNNDAQGRALTYTVRGDAVHKEGQNAAGNDMSFPAETGERILRAWEDFNGVKRDEPTGGNNDNAE
jgi:hypothetical protein